MPDMTTVIYLPGLGGKYDRFRMWALKLWKRRDRNVVFLPMDWTSPYESFIEKKSRVIRAVSDSEGQVVIIGESAGAAMGLLIAHEMPHVKFIAFCGKIGGAKSTGSFYYERVPAFADMLPLADTVRTNLRADEKLGMITVRAYKDLFLSVRDTTIPGVRQIVLPSVGHLTTIVLGITILRFGLLRAIRQLTK